MAAPGYWAKPTVVAPAVAVDLIVGLPFIGWLVLVRGRRMPIAGLLPLAVGGLVLARWWIPSPHQGGWLRLAGPALELALLAAVGLRVRRFRSRHRTDRADRRLRPLDAAREAAREVLGPRVGDVVVGELAALWYAVTGWGRFGPREEGVHYFPGHKRRGYGAILGALILVMVPETLVVHVLLTRWSALAAWVATGLAAYSVVWLLGDFHAARLNPSAITDGGLSLRVGLRWRVDVPWSAVVRYLDAAPDQAAVRMTLLGRPEGWVELRHPVDVTGLLGMRRRGRFLGVSLDEPDAFRREVSRRALAAAGGRVGSAGIGEEAYRSGG